MYQNSDKGQSFCFMKCRKPNLEMPKKISFFIKQKVRPISDFGDFFPLYTDVIYTWFEFDKRDKC